MSERLELRLPLPPNTANARGHWRTRRKKRLAWRGEATLALYRAGIQPPRAPWARVRVSARLFPHQIMDDDNAVARLKEPLDLLQRLGFIENDKRPACCLAGIPPQRIDRKEPRLELLLERLEEGEEP